MLRPIVAVRSYGLYATVMTPLIILLLELGEPVHASIILYRVAHTAIGCLIALTCGSFVGRRVSGATTEPAADAAIEIA